MKAFTKISILLAGALLLLQCRRDDEVDSIDYSGVYCLNMQNLELTIVQTGDSVNFTVSSGIIMNGTGYISGNILELTGISTNAENFSSVLTFSEDGQSFMGPVTLTDQEGTVAFESVLLGNKGECPEFDIELTGIPKMVENDFTELSKIEDISKFRSGVGHSYTDGFEECRSMKHYYNSYESERKNNNVKIFSPVTGTIISVSEEKHGESSGLNNKQIQIVPDNQPAFSFVLFHVDLLSSDIIAGKKVENGELLGHARFFYEDLNEYASSFDIAVWVNTPSGVRLISYFETLNDGVFDAYASRGGFTRDDFIITNQWRDAHPLECDGEMFLSGSTQNDWVQLQ